MAKIKIKKRVMTATIAKGLPLEDRQLLPAYVDVPKEPDYDKSVDRQEHEEQQVARVEIMMTKGVRSKRNLMALLDIRDGREMDRYIRRVHARWETLGTQNEFARHRGEGLNRLDLIEGEIWARVGQLDPKHPNTSQVVLQHFAAVLKVQEMRSELLGLTPKVIAHITTMPDADGDISRRITQHERLAGIAARMMDLIREREAMVIDHEPTED